MHAAETAAAPHAPARPVPMSHPAWMPIAQAELGTKEVPGAGHNAAILGYFDAVTYRATTDETPWCAAFASWALERAGVASTRSARARSYAEGWGVELEAPRYGAVAVFWRGRRDGPAGHVGFYVGRGPDGRPLILGGNQSDAVTVAPIGEKRLLGYYWPGGVALDLPDAPPPPRRSPAESRTVRAAGAVGLGGLLSAVSTLTPLAGDLAAAVEGNPAGAILIAGLAAVAVAALFAWLRLDDWRRGRR